MKAAKKDAVLNCEAIGLAITEIQNLIKGFEGSSPEDVRKRIEAFASALKQSGLVREEEKDKKAKILLSDLIELLPMKEFAPHMAEVEAFEMTTSEYNDPDADAMEEGGELFESFGPKLIAELERIRKECLEAKAKS
jgi:hypothetical protein